MPKTATARRAGLPLLLLPALAPAQSITTAPSPVAAIPVDNPVALALLLVALAIAAAFALRRGHGARRVLALLLVAGAAVGLGHGSSLMAQVVTAFTNPAGETLPIPVSPITAGGFTGFEPADFTNSTGQPVRITAIVLPDAMQCFATNAANTLLPAGSPISSPYPACAQGTLLALGARCRVDVEAVCRSLVPPPPSVTVAAISPSTGSASGGVGITLTGTNLLGATGITFGGVPATSVNVVNATTITAVTPAHADGAVDVVVTTPAGNATRPNGYTYLTTVVGQSAFGGTIAALDGGLQNLVAAMADNSTNIEWGGNGTIIGAAAQSDTDGASNSAAIVSALGFGSHAAQMCENYEVDSQGNQPCEPGNACYSDWFLPARNQLDALFVNRTAIGGFGFTSYWSSTEHSGNPAVAARSQEFAGGTSNITSKSFSAAVRCVRAFTP